MDIRKEIDDKFDNNFIGKYINQLKTTIKNAEEISGFFSSLTPGEVSGERFFELVKITNSINNNAFEAYRDLYQLYKDAE